MAHRRDLRRTKYFEAVKEALTSDFASEVSHRDLDQVLYHPRKLVVLPPPSPDGEPRVEPEFLKLVARRLRAAFPEMKEQFVPPDGEMPPLLTIPLPERAALMDQLDSFDMARQIQADNGPGEVAPEYYTVTQQYVQPGEDPDPGDPVPGLEDLAQVRQAAEENGLGEGISIAVLDTGIDGVIDRVLRADKHVHDQQDVDELRDPSGAARPSSTGLTVLDPAAGHGTFIAGLIHTVAPAATVISIKVASPLGVASESNLATGIKRALAQGANIINLSLGGYAFVENSKWPTLPAFGLLEQTIAKVPPNIAIVAAAGNCGSSAPFYPAAFHERVVGVAALTSKARLWAQSNYGDWVRACARGVGLGSVFVKGEENPDFVPDTPDVFPYDLNYARWSGTSFAAPLVAAQIGIVAQALGLVGDTNRAAEFLLAMSAAPLGMPRCGKRVLVNVPGQS